MKPQYADVGALIGLGSAFLGYKGAKAKADAEKANNALKEEQYEWEKSKEAPAVTGAQDALSGGFWIDPATGQPVAEGTEGAVWQSQFQPFISGAGKAAMEAGNIGGKYLQSVGGYYDAGERGLAAFNDLADLTYADRKALADQYTADYEKGAYDLAAGDINRDALAQDRNLARGQGRFGALSSQKARSQAYGDQARTDALLRAAERARAGGYDRMQTELARRRGVAGDLTTLGASGLSRAGSAYNLADTAVRRGIEAPFLPFKEYGNTVSGVPSASAPTYQPVTDPFTTGVGLGLGAWNTFKGGQ